MKNSVLLKIITYIYPFQVQTVLLLLLLGLSLQLTSQKTQKPFDENQKPFNLSNQEYAPTVPKDPNSTIGPLLSKITFTKIDEKLKQDLLEEDVINFFSQLQNVNLDQENLKISKSGIKEIQSILLQSHYQSDKNSWPILMKEKQSLINQVNNFLKSAQEHHRQLMSSSAQNLLDRMGQTLNRKTFSFQLSLNDKELQNMRSIVEKSRLDAVLKSSLVKEIFLIAQKNQQLLNNWQEYYRTVDVLNLVLSKWKKVIFSEATNSVLGTLNGNVNTHLNEAVSNPHSQIVAPRGMNVAFSIILSLFTLMSFFYGLFEKKKYQRELSHQKKLMEQGTLKILDTLIMKQQPIDTTKESFSDDFKGMLKYLHEYVAKKMSYGQIFQETIPFPTVMIDQDLKVRWFNNQFIEQWNLSELEINQDHFTWDILCGRTNLSSSLPITDAMKNRLSGIYQIQVKKFGQESLLPYQMYVIPYAIEKRPHCLLFFYPLLTLEETMAMQTKSLIGPVTRTLRSLVQGSYDEKFAIQSRREYEVGGIEDLHDLFDDLYQLHGDRVDRLSHEISELESTSSQASLELSKVYQHLKLMTQSEVQLQQSLMQLKQTIIKLFEVWTDQQQKMKDLLFSFEESILTGQELQQVNKVLHEEFGRFIHNGQTMTSLRLHSKEGREQIAQMKTILNRFAKTWQSFQEKMQKSLSALSQQQSNQMSPSLVTMLPGAFNLCDLQVKEMVRVSDFLGQSDKLMQHVDLTVSKFSMQLEEVKKLVTNETLVQPQKISQWQSSNKKFSESIEQSESKMQQYQEDFVLCLSTLYQDIQHHLKSLHYFDDQFKEHENLAQHSTLNKMTALQFSDTHLQVPPIPMDER